MKLPKVGDYFILHNDSGPPLRISAVFTRKGVIMVKARANYSYQMLNVLFWGSKDQCDRVQAARKEFQRAHFAAYQALHKGYLFVLDQAKKERNDG